MVPDFFRDVCQIKVLLNYGEEHFSLSVADDGCGFDPAHPTPSEGGFGLVGMHERARELSGRLDVRSAPDRGTAIDLRVPLDTPLLSAIFQAAVGGVLVFLAGWLIGSG